MRNVALIAESIQNDIRHSTPMFMGDFAQAQAYGDAAGPAAHDRLQQCQLPANRALIEGGRAGLDRLPA